MVRADLPPTQQAIQAVHASAEAINHFYKTTTNLYTVLLSVPDERALIRAMRELDDKSVRFRAFIESDMEFQLTALACEPISGKKRNIFRRYKLLNLH